MPKKNNQFKIKKETPESKVGIWLREDGIIEFKIAGLFDKKLEKEVLNKMEEEKEIIEKLPGKAKLFTDTSEFSTDLKIGWSDWAETRKTVIDFLKWDKIEKIAIVGKPGSVFLKTLISFMFGVAGLKNTKYFANREEAIKWLKE